MGAALCWLISQVVFIYIVVIFIYLITRLLIQFGVVNSYNQVVQFVLRFGAAAVEPALAPIQRIIPPIGGMDLSPIVLILLLGFVQRVLCWLLMMPLFN